jgi:hypothetical protein
MSETLGLGLRDGSPLSFLLNSYSNLIIFGLKMLQRLQLYLQVLVLTAQLIQLSPLLINLRVHLLDLISKLGHQDIIFLNLASLILALTVSIS